MEVTKGNQTTVKWINELVKNPVACRKEKKSGGVKGKKSTACNFLAPLVGNNQGYHWANPPQNCSDGTAKTDCMGPEGLPLYDGPVPTIPHVHGAHAAPEYDGYAESWWLPHSNNIPKGYAPTGSWYEGPKSLGRRKVLSTSTSPSSTDNKGYAVFEYPNDQKTTGLWFHDHTLGMTLQNVYSIGYGHWIIRTEDNSEDGLDEKDCKGEFQKLPGPPPLLGQDPNNDLSVRCKIREIPLAIQVRSFYNDGSIYVRKGSDEFINYEFDMMTVNGNTWPKLNVARDRYRFRLLNGSGLREMFGLYTTYRNSDGVENELPFHVIGSDQGLLPKVAVVYRKSATVFKDCGDTGEDLPIKRGLTLSPGERYDVILDFSELAVGTVVYMKNENYLPQFIMYQPEEVMCFIVTEDLCGKHSGETPDSSTAPADMVLKPREDIEGVTNPIPRDLSLQNVGHQVLIGIDARKSGYSKLKLWSDPITENPGRNSIEIWVTLVCVSSSKNCLGF
mmetsp:Transcript_26689/g.38266  ORF Transcript_26689/g.38266 Transcript_26689/m.38266 type:complete len:503 (-) Transcript_26689:588-2096(-)